MKGKKGTKLAEWQTRLNEYGGKCDKCGHITDYLTVDHIIPLSFIYSLDLKSESLEHDWNFQGLCRACNKLKGNDFDFTDQRTFKLIRKYVDMAEEKFNN